MPVHNRTSSSGLLHLITAIGIGLAAFLLAFLLFNLAFSLLFMGRIMPGVSMNGIPLGGMTVDEATTLITQTYIYPQAGSVMLVDGEKYWTVKPVQLGFYLDPVASANTAYDAGRRGGLIKVLLQRVNFFKEDIRVEPTFIFNQKTAIETLNSLAAEINQTVREAGISIQGTEVIVQNGQTGRALDVSDSLEAITRQVETMQDGIVPLVVRQSEPVILSADTQGDLARTVLSEPLTLTLPADSGAVQIQPADLAPLLTFEKVDNGQSAQYQIAVSHTLMGAWLNSMKEKLEQQPENTRFMFDDDTRQLVVIKPAVIGRTLDVENSILAIDQALQSGQHSVALAFTFTDPAVTDQMTGADLGITELVELRTTYFAGSTDERIQNIKTAAEQFHGLLVAPGETLSMADVLGDISVEKGYTQALIILDDKTIEGVGGGVCQVSTTLFRTALYAGFPIVERHPHAYRVGYYEQVNSAGKHDADMAGFDAAVFVPLVDFKFTNDSPYWLLMETYTSPTYKSLTWKFYSTKDGREVNVNSDGPTNLIDPPDPVYRENPDLPQGTKKHVEYAAQGADVTVTRTVSRNGTVLSNDKFFTSYEPWGDVYEYGPGTEIPTPTPSP